MTYDLYRADDIVACSSHLKWVKSEAIEAHKRVYGSRDFFILPKHS